MKKLIALLAFVCLFAVAGIAQTQPERRVIEVSGSAERYVTPDTFTFKITLFERIENKQKITIEQQENALRAELTRLGVDVAKDLSVYDISSTYFRQKKVKDVLGTKDYRLMIRDLNKIAQLQELADRLNIAKLDLIDSENSEMTRHRREVKIEAIKAAKAKAEYLLAAIGERLGKAVSIKEETEATGYSTSNTFSNSNETSNFRSNARSASSSSDESLTFTAEKIRFVIVARFEIE